MASVRTCPAEPCAIGLGIALCALERSDVTTAWHTFLDGDALRFDGNAVLTTARK